MLYEMQFQLGKAAELAASPYESIESIKNNNRAIVIFDENKNSLFLNAVAKQILENRTDVSVIGDWIRSRVENLKEIDVFKLSELPLEITLTNQQQEDVEVVLRRLEVSAKFELELNEYESLAIRETKIEPSYVRSLKVFPPESKNLAAINYDLLTGLPNYNLLLKYIEQEINFCRQRQNYQFIVLFIDIDRFEVINSSLGRILGDRLLVAITQRLKQCLRSNDFIARMGNDEFAILLSNVDLLNHATNVAKRIYHQLGIPFNVEGYEVFLEVSIGIAVGNNEYSKPEHLLRDVELAVSDAKRQSKFSYRIFEPSMRGKALTLLQLENDLRKAFKNDELILYYQPIVYLKNNTIQGFEALVRWRHPKRGIVGPEEFISLAESTGLIVPLGFWVLKEACQQMYAWIARYDNLSNWKISVNISSKQLELPNFVAQVTEILKETSLNPHNLKLEITETSLVEDTQHTILVIRELKALGIEFSLDDFGTGYSSLSYLHQFPFDTIKIDRSFVNSFEDNDEKIGIVRAIISLANNLGMNTIAEGIETDNQLAQLKALKCEYGQGYYLSKPLDKQIVETVIATEVSKPQTAELPDRQLLLNEQIAKEQLLFEIAHLRQEVEELKAERKDLEIMLETTTQHADIIESQLHNEICDRQKAQAALSLANRELEKLCVLDDLTQVANRRRFDNYLLQEWQKLQKEQAPISLILCDIDYFKLYNDTYGHPIGDYCLQQVALTIECVIESTPGLVARYGGEEFGIVLPNIEQELALQIAEKIALSIEQLHIAHQKSLVSNYVTLSLGVYGLVPNLESSPELLVLLADKALYQAKQGRNRACLYVDEEVGAIREPPAQE